jgi:hypothetical protein
MLTLRDYWMGRDAEYPLAMTPDIEHNAQTTVRLVNELLARAAEDDVRPHTHPKTGTLVSSGWRPPALNAATPGAAFRSKHMTGEAIDLFDPEGDLDEWLMGAAGQLALTQVGLWMEHPSATKGWCHLQTKPPRSGRRVFYP